MRNIREPVNVMFRVSLLHRDPDLRNPMKAIVPVLVSALLIPLAGGQVPIAPGAIQYRLLCSGQRAGRDARSDTLIDLR